MTSETKALLEKLQEALKGKPEKVPKGHKTCAQWAKEWNKKRTTAQLLIRKGVEQGILGMAEHRVQVGKILRKTEHYFEIK